MLIQVIREEGLSLKDNLPTVLKHLDPEIRIQSRLSDITAKVDKYIESSKSEDELDRFHMPVCGK